MHSDQSYRSVGRLGTIDGSLIALDVDVSRRLIPISQPLLVHNIVYNVNFRICKADC